jgi:hypothetical protein
MEETGSSRIGHSPRVRLWLEQDGQRLRLRQVAPDWVLPDQPVSLPPGEAIVVSEIDGRQYRRAVVLPEGVTLARKVVPIRDAVGIA